MGDKRKMLHEQKLKKLKRRKKERKEREEQKKKIDELSNSMNEMIEIVKNLQHKSDLEEISLKEKETPKECCFESEDADMKNPNTIFVLGFDCSFPRDDIRRSLKEHFSSCGEVSKLFLPFHCKTGAPMGFAFINMKGDPKKALKLNQTFMGRQRLLVTMAITRDEYSGYSNHKGCQRCRTVLMKRRVKHFHERYGRLRGRPSLL